jgi:NADH:ubiquinone oxidoreductase subunit K
MGSNPILSVFFDPSNKNKYDFLGTHNLVNFFFFSNQLVASFYIVYICILGYLLFFFGFIGFIKRQISLIYILLSIELMFFGLNIVFLFSGFFFYLLLNQLIVLLLLVLSAVETALLLSIIFLYARQFQTTDLIFLQILKY